MSRILIVEDDKDWQEYIAELLLGELDGVSIRPAATLESAKEALEEPIDLAIVDINLTDVLGNQDGMKFIKYLEKVDQTIPVIIVSGTIPATSETLTKQVSVLGFFSKPKLDDELDNFMSTVSKALRSGQNEGDVA